MILRINKLKNFGIFKDFSWNGLDNFKKKNLIYGWNYSGKTTLSKLFQNLEFKDKDKYFAGSEFSITTQLDNITKDYCENDLENFPFDVKVFNTNYIKRIFTWDNPQSDIQPISFYLGDPSGELDKKIKKLTEYNQILDKRAECLQAKYIDEFEKYNKLNGKFSVKAKEIRENYLNNKLDQNKLHKGTILEITNRIKDSIDNYILSDEERDKAKAEAIAENNYEIQRDDFSFHENLEKLAEKVRSILEDTAPKSISLPELDDDEELFNWVQTGLKLHKDATECKFCTNTLPKNRIDDLNSYYSKKLQEIQGEINLTLKSILAEREKLEISFFDKYKLAASFRKDYQKAIDNYNETAKKYKSQLFILESDLKRKNSQLFNNIPASKIEIISLKEDLESIKKSVKAHNDWIAEFDNNQKEALNKLLNHYVAEYLKEEDYLTKEKNKDRATVIIKNITSKISTNKTNKLELEAQLKSSVKGQEELNDILEILLHRDDIKIEIRNDKFTLERRGHPASDLSEGEKSAIAFAYFLTELKALRNDAPRKSPNTIVFIDDPISSLDSNHIFQVRELLNQFFKNDDFAQLFISTHNFEFFSVMLDVKLFGRIEKSTPENKRPLYFIKRNDDNTATIKKLPNSFSSYKSEYVGLFHIINEFNDLENKEDFPNLLILPNVVRRFLELYTLMKYPSEKDLDNRIRTVFNPEDKPFYNTKLLHWFSHQNQFEKIQQHDDKILQLKDAISELIEYIKNNDELHWKGLIGE